MEIKNFKILKVLRINAIVLYPFVIYCDKKPSQEIVRHEHVHLAQIKRDGVTRFYANYLLEYLKGRRTGMTHHEAYRNISYEREAYGS